MHVRHNAYPPQADCLPPHEKRRLSPACAGLSLCPPLYIFRGSMTQTCGTSRFIGASSIHPASDSRLRACPWISLLIRQGGLSFSQVGLRSILILTHWVTISNFIPPSGNPNDLCLTRHDHWLVMLFYLGRPLDRNLPTRLDTIP